MSWFKVDDGFHDHPKVEELPNAAVGLWVKAGTWCARHETDGIIPASKVKSLKGTSAQISALIRTGLWVETTTTLGAKAYSFCDWFDYQPSREEREEAREVWREKKRESRRRKLDNLRKRENVPQGVPEMSPRGQQGGVPQMSGTIPVPSRPDPTIKEKTSKKETGTVAPFPTRRNDQRKPDGKRMSDWLPADFFDHEPPPDGELPPDEQDFIDAEVINAD